MLDIVYFVVGIVFVSGVESVLCSSMADRLAKNDRTPFNPDKEFFGQGLVQIITPLVQGFPCTGALARTATSIKAGATTPMAGYFKAILKLTMAFYLAQYLELIPMACIGGILVWVASNMIKPSEIKEIKHAGKFEFWMMIFECQTKSGSALRCATAERGFSVFRGSVFRRRRSTARLRRDKVDTLKG
jgi:SulP family sulfate permease